MVEDRVIRHNEIDPKGRRIIIFIGVEGSGKTTGGLWLSKQLHLPYVGTGDIIRETAENDPGELGDACREMSRLHNYLDPDLMLQVITRRLLKPDVANGAVIDGALRTLEETQHFDAALKSAQKEGFEIDVMYLDVPKEVGIQRRLDSPNKRPDDTREGLEERVKNFYKNLAERMEIIKENYRFHHIDALPPEDEVHAEVLRSLR